MKVGKVTFDEAYRAVSEYRKKFPEKAVTYYAQNYPDMAWAVFMASGSCPVVPVADESFLLMRLLWIWRILVQISIRNW